MSKHLHPNIVQLLEVIRESDQQVCFVFEYLAQGNLYEFIKRHTPPPKVLTNTISTTAIQSTPTLLDSQIRSITRQILEGLSFLHSQGYTHRDIKPENILLGPGNVAKLADFGLCRETDCPLPVTDYVSTRWYRAPEVLLRSPNYDKMVDLFGVGCVVAEMYSKRPLFPGENEIDQVHLITQVLGTPDKCWKQGYQLANKLGVVLRPHKNPKSLREKMPATTPVDAIDFMSRLLQWNPKDRPTCQEAIASSYFVPQIGALKTPYETKKRNLAMVTADRDENSPPSAKKARTYGASPRSIHSAWDMYEIPPLAEGSGDQCLNPLATFAAAARY
jgi:serine/threonine protein kinase